MSSAACVFEQCSTSYAVADAELSLSTSPLYISPQIDLWLSEVDFEDFRQNTPVACRRKTLDEILAGVSPTNSLMPRQLDEALEFKRHEEQQQEGTVEYDEVILSARGDHEHVDEETKKKYTTRQSACDVPSRIWQWLRIAF